jgi:hypothetical protein
MAIATVIGAVILTVQYFVLVPVFALLARRAGRRELPGWQLRPHAPEGGLQSQY